jgi:REP element-mobilizing transposase RayT
MLQYRKSNRLKNYDYSQGGAYFVTICTRDQKIFFGEVAEGVMTFNAFGKIADDCWREIPKHFPDCVLNEYVVMPNHVHGILLIVESETVAVENTHACSLRPCSLRRQNQKLPIIVGAFKSAVSKYLHQKFPDSNFAWQKSYHDRIIRDEKEWQRIAEYIHLNPSRWEQEKNNVENIFDLN